MTKPAMLTLLATAALTALTAGPPADAKQAAAPRQTVMTAPRPAAEPIMARLPSLSVTTLLIAAASDAAVDGAGAELVGGADEDEAGIEVVIGGGEEDPLGFGVVLWVSATAATAAAATTTTAATLIAAITPLFRFGFCGCCG